MTFDKELFDMDKLVCNGDMHAEDVLVLASSINKQLHRANEVIAVLEEALEHVSDYCFDDRMTPIADKALAKARELRGER